MTGPNELKRPASMSPLTPWQKKYGPQFPEEWRADILNLEPNWWAHLPQVCKEYHPPGEKSYTLKSLCLKCKCVEKKPINPGKIANNFCSYCKTRKHGVVHEFQEEVVFEESISNFGFKIYTCYLKEITNIYGHPGWTIDLTNPFDEQQEKLDIIRSGFITINSKKKDPRTFIVCRTCHSLFDPAAENDVKRVDRHKCVNCSAMNWLMVYALPIYTEHKKSIFKYPFLPQFRKTYNRLAGVMTKKDKDGKMTFYKLEKTECVFPAAPGEPASQYINAPEPSR